MAMDVPDPAALSRLALDHLPSNVAVVAADGEIVHTNRAWSDFGAENARTGDDVGENYFETSDTAAASASDAITGIRAVLDGERELFTQEYPCHGEGERRWFLMRVTRFVADGEPYAVVAHVDITDRKLAELSAERARDDLEHVLHRVEGLVEDVTGALVEAADRGAVESAVCETVVDADPYAFSWIGDRDLRSETVAVGSSAAARGAQTAGGPEGSDASETTEEAASETTEPDPGEGDAPGDYLDAIDRSLADGTEPGVRALRTGEPVVVQDVAAAADDWASAAAERGFAAAFAMPLAYRGSTYGVWTVYAEEPGAFDDRERRVLSALGRAVATTVHALETRRILTTDRVIELDLAVRSRDLFFVRLAADLDCELEHRGSVADGEGPPLVFLAVEGADGDDVVRYATADAGIEAATVLAERDDESVLEFRPTETPLVALLADHGGATRAISAADGEARITVEIPAESDARAFVAAVEDRFPGVELVGYRERERRERTVRDLRADLTDRLTERQLAAITRAHVGGFFEWPRPITGDDLAESMGVSRSTFHQHLRAAERKLVDGVFDER